jgi:hypothetical protein
MLPPINESVVVGVDVDVESVVSEFQHNTNM